MIWFDRGKIDRWIDKKKYRYIEDEKRKTIEEISSVTNKSGLWKRCFATFPTFAIALAAFSPPFIWTAQSEQLKNNLFNK